MSRLVTRDVLRRVLVGVVAGAAAAGPNLAIAQLTCYIRKCVIYPDGSQICERTPVDCSTLPPPAN